MRFTTLAALAALTFAAPFVQAQTQVMNIADTARRASLCLLFDKQFNSQGAIAINFTQPEWKDTYTAAIDSGKFKGTTQRLGKNWWTSFDTTVALEVGGTKVPAGSYYLALQIGNDNKPNLMFIDAATANKNGWVPFNPTAWKSDLTAPLTLAKDSLKEVVSKMEISIKADEKNASSGRFSVQWGKHELSADVKLQVANGGAAKDAGAKKNDGK